MLLRSNRSSETTVCGNLSHLGLKICACRSCCISIQSVDYPIECPRLIIVIGIDCTVSVV